MQEALFQQYAQVVQDNFGIQLPIEKRLCWSQGCSSY